MADSLGYIFLASAILLIVSMVMMLGRLLGGPTLYDRLLAVNSFGTKTVLFLCVFCFIIDRPDGVDIALLYALMNFIATIAVLKYFNYRALDVTLTGDSRPSKTAVKTSLSSEPVSPNAEKEAQS